MDSSGLRQNSEHSRSYCRQSRATALFSSIPADKGADLEILKILSLARETRPLYEHARAVELHFEISLSLLNQFSVILSLHSQTLVLPVVKGFACSAAETHISSLGVISCLLLIQDVYKTELRRNHNYFLTL